MNNFLVVATHPDVPNVRQTLCADSGAANRQAIDFVNDLVRGYFDAPDVSEEIAEIVGFPLDYNGEWRWKLRAVQWARMVEIDGDAGTAGETLVRWTQERCDDTSIEPLTEYDAQSFSPLTNPEHARAFDAFVADCRGRPDELGFPHVWIETPAVRSDPAVEPPAAIAGLALGDVLSAVGYGDSFTTHWIEDVGQDDVDREEAAKACELIERVEKALPPHFAAVAELVAACTALLDEYRGNVPDRLEPAVARVSSALLPLGAVEDAAPAKQPRVAVVVSGGVLQSAIADVPFDVIVVDYDVGQGDGIFPMIEQEADKPEPASVWVETATVQPDWLDMVAEASETAGEKVRRSQNNECVECGADLDSPSSAGVEDGVCGPCIAGDSE